MKKIYVYMLFIVLTISACSSPRPTEQADSSQPPVSTPTLVRADLTWEQSLLVSQLSEKTGVSTDEIEVAVTEAVTWPDRCMGVVRMGVMCAQGEVPGFRFVLIANDKEYEYHTNRDMTVILLFEDK
jgi:hypothetical protein